MSEQFINVYVEILNNSFVEAMNKNLVLQAQNKIAEQEIAKCKDQLQAVQQDFVDSDTIRKELLTTKNELNVSKNDNQNLERFRGELQKARDELNNISAQLEELKIANTILETEKTEFQEQIKALKDQLGAKRTSTNVDLFKRQLQEARDDLDKEIAKNLELTKTLEDKNNENLDKSHSILDYVNSDESKPSDIKGKPKKQKTLEYEEINTTYSTKDDGIF